MKTNKTSFKAITLLVAGLFGLWTTGCSIPNLSGTGEENGEATTTQSKATSGRVLNATWAGIESALQANPNVNERFAIKALHDESEESDSSDTSDGSDLSYSCELNYSAEFGGEEDSEILEVVCEAPCNDDGSGTVEVSMTDDGSTTEFTVSFDKCEMETCDGAAVVSGSGSVTIADSCEAAFNLDLSIEGEGDLDVTLDVALSAEGDVCGEVESCADYAGSILLGDEEVDIEEACGTMEEELTSVCEESDESDTSDGSGESDSEECSSETVSCDSDFACQQFADEDLTDDYEIDNVECVSGCCEIVDDSEADWYDEEDYSDEDYFF